MSEEFIFWASLECVVNLEELLINFYALSHTISSCSSFHSVDLWSCAGASSCLAFLLLVWITFRDGNLSLNFCSFKLWSEHVTPSFSDGNFRLNVRMLFIGVVDCLAQNSPWLPSGCCDSHYSLLQSILVPSRIIVHSLFLFVENL